MPFNLDANTLANSMGENQSPEINQNTFQMLGMNQQNPNQNQMMGNGYQPDQSNVSPNSDALFGDVSSFGAPLEDYQETPEQNANPNQANNNDNQNNEAVRYQYFQSQYDKERQRNQELEKEIAMIKGSLNTIQSQQGQQNNQQQMQQPQEEEQFPEFNIPVPQRPLNFSYNEAYTDQNSESAKYLYQKEQYDNSLRQYQDYKMQFILAKQKESEERLANKYQEDMRKMEIGNKVNQIVDEVKWKYGLNHQQALDFVQKMSDNNVYTLDNMVKFYMTSLNQNNLPQNQIPNGLPQNNMGYNGGYQQPYQQMYNQQNPSDQFNQMRRSQAIPNIMNVLPQQNTVDTSPAKTFFDSILATETGRKLNFN